MFPERSVDSIQILISRRYKNAALDEVACKELERQVREQYLNEMNESLLLQLHRSRRWLHRVVIIAVVLIILTLAAGALTAIIMSIFFS